MPKLHVQNDDLQQHKIAGGNFGFSATRLDKLGATEYTLATVAVDVTGSVDGFEKELLVMLKTAVKSCKKSPRAANLMVRVILFSDALQGGIEEVHGFKLLSDIDPDKDYGELHPGGMTPLTDAVYSGVGATLTYAEQLTSQDFLVNGIVFTITDGGDNSSKTTPAMVKKQLKAAVTGERIESLVTVLIGINAAACQSVLEDFKNETGMDQYIDAGNATPGKLAKLAAFVSQSVSSQSQALGTGGPSQNIAATI